MNGCNLHGNTVIAEAQSTRPTVASSHSIDHILYKAGSVTRQPKQYGATHASTNISWHPSFAHNETNYDGKNIICTRQVPIAQHLTASLQQNYPCNKDLSSTVDRSQIVIATSFESSTANNLELDDEQLKSIDTKDLNKLIKKKGISKTRETQIKARRRTLRNRGNLYIGFSAYLKNIYIIKL